MSCADCHRFHLKETKLSVEVPASQGHRVGDGCTAGLPTQITALANALEMAKRDMAKLFLRLIDKAEPHRLPPDEKAVAFFEISRS